MEISSSLSIRNETHRPSFPQGQHTFPDIDTLGYIQCVTCGKMLGHLYNKADEWRRKNLSEIEVYERLGLKRTCCRYHLTLGIKMPMVKYIDENVRLDLVGTSHDTGSHEDLHVEDHTLEMKEDVDLRDKEKVNGIKNRLARLRDASNQVMGRDSMVPNGSQTTNSRKISIFVAT
jgi:DNA-directed RNA polymerase subunit N (RpoN/RPB10)